MTHVTCLYFEAMSYIFVLFIWSNYLEITNGQTHDPYMSYGSEFTQYSEYNNGGATTLQCADNIPCVVNCYEYAACYYVTIVGPSDSTLTINCNANYGNYYSYDKTNGCAGNKIYAQNSTQLIINVYNEVYQFYGGTIYTPTQSINKLNTFITCGIISSETKKGATDDTCHSSGVLSQHIYSVDGFNSVQWKYGGTHWTVETAAEAYYTCACLDAGLDTMYCGSNYQYSCTGFMIVAAQLTCTDTTSPCAAITTTDYPTASTNQPTTFTNNPSTSSATNNPSMDEDACDTIDRWDFADCSDEQGPKEQSILFDVSLNVCLLDDRFSRLDLWNWFKWTYGQMIEANMNSMCSVNVEAFYVETYEYQRLIRSYEANVADAPDRIDCETICNANEYGYALSTQIALYCNDEDGMSLIYEVLLERIDSGAFYEDFEEIFWGFSIDEDNVCQKGLGSIQVTSATLQWRDVNGDDVDVLASYEPNEVQAYTIVQEYIMIVAVVFKMF
eukprot:165812_1